MSSDVNNTLDKRQGHSTRAGVRYALQTCDWNEEDALWMLKNQDKLVKQSARCPFPHDLGSRLRLR